MTQRIAPNRIRWYNNCKKANNQYFLVWDKNRLMRNRLKQITNQT